MAESRMSYIRKHDTWDGRLKHLNSWLSTCRPTSKPGERYGASSTLSSYEDSSTLSERPWMPLVKYNKCSDTPKDMRPLVDKFLKSYRRLCEKIEKRWCLEPNSIKKRVSSPPKADSSNLNRLFLLPFPVTLKKIEAFCKEFGMSEIQAVFNCERFKCFGLLREEYCKIVGAIPLGPKDNFDEYYVIMERWYLLEMLTLLCDALEPQKVMGYFLLDSSIENCCINLFAGADVDEGRLIPVYTDDTYDGVDALQCLCPDEYYSCRGMKKHERILDFKKQPVWASKEFLEACQRERFSIIPEVQLVEQKFATEDFVKKSVNVECYGRESFKLDVGLELFKLNLDFTGIVGRLDMDCVGVGSRIGLDEHSVYRFMSECKFGIKNFEFFRPVLMFDQNCGTIQSSDLGEDCDCYKFSDFLCANLCLVVGDMGYDHIKMYQKNCAAYLSVSARSIFREGCRTMRYPVLKIGPSQGKRKADAGELTEALPVKRAQLSEEQWKTVAEKTE